MKWEDEANPAVLLSMNQIMDHLVTQTRTEVWAVPAEAIMVLLVLPAVALPVCQEKKYAAWAVWAVKHRKAVWAAAGAVVTDPVAKATQRPVPVHNAAPVDEEVEAVPGNNLVFIEKG
jgi:hypothetical protein